MDAKKFLIGTLVGGVAFFLVGYIIYGLALASFFTSHAGGDMKAMEQLVWWALILGNFAYGGLLSYIFVKWAHISTFGSGASGGAAIGFFLSLSMDMIRFATSNSMDLTGSIVDVVAATVMAGICGGIIAAVLGMGNKS